MTHPTQIHTYFAAKGGQGTTVTAAVVALMHARAGRSTLLVDAAEPHDSHAVLGLAEPAEPRQPTPVVAHLDLCRAEPATIPTELDGYEIVVIDAGHRPAPEPGTTTLVTRSCYLALRHAVALAVAPDRVVLIQEPERALRHDDIAAVLGRPVVTVPASPAVARTVDAGLLAGRIPNCLHPLTTLTDTTHPADS